MPMIEAKALQAFLKDVATYAAFLDNWFPAERWSSTEPPYPLHSGALTSAEIAYVLLRFGKFHTSDWETWRSGGFVALDTAINETLLHTKNLPGIAWRESSAEAEEACASEELTGLQTLLYGEPGTDVPAYTRLPLLYALAVHVFLKRSRHNAEVVSFCRQLNLIVSCKP